jgi:hypothetical protein
MLRHFVAADSLLSLLFSINAFTQDGFATLTGSVSGGTGARIPRVTVKATAVDISIVTALLNKA